MKFVPLALAFAIFPFSLAAQDAAPTHNISSSTFSVPIVGGGCPVSMQLQQRLGDQLETVQKDGRVYKAPATQLLLTIADWLSPGPGSSPVTIAPAALNSADSKTEARTAARRRVVHAISATAIAYGFAGQPRAELVAPGLYSRGNALSGPATRLQLQFSSNDRRSIAQLWLPSFGAIRWLELDSITWSDGSSWRPDKGEACTVKPSLFMLVGSDSAAGNTNP